MTEVRGSLFQGTQPVVGYFFSVSLLGEQQCRLRILDLWQPRCRLFRLARGYLLCLGETRFVDVTTTPGLSLVDFQGVFTPTPLRASEVTALELGQGDWVLVWQGQAEKLSLTHDCLMDPSEWLDLSDYPILCVTSLGQPPRVTIQQPRDVKQEALAEAVDQRDDRGIREVVTAMHQLSDQERPASPGKSRSRPARKGFWHRVSVKFIRWTMDRQGKVVTRQALSKRQGQGSPKAASPFRGSFWDKLLLKLGAATLFQKQHAKHLRRMMDLFEQGKLSEALRYAVPLGGDASPEHGSQLGFLRPRDGLRLGQGGDSSGGSLWFGRSFYQYLEEHYEHTFQKLDARGQVEQAAYVLETLLNQPQRAVRYLEEKGVLRKAVEVAESRNLAAEWVIRLHMQLGDRERALLWARRSGAFFQALQMLEQRDKEAARLWRTLWARHLALCGDYVAAVDIAWPLPELHRVAATWIDLALTAGGASAMRMLAKSIHLKPNDRDAQVTKVKEVLASRDTVGARNRQVFAQSLLDIPGSETVRWSAIALMRALLLDVAEDRATGLDQLLKNLNSVAIGGAMLPELKVLSQQPKANAKPRATRGPTHVYRLEERGAAPIYDSVLSDDGRLFLALGEAGVRYLSRKRKRLYSADVPAYRLVPADRCDRAIAMAPRNDWLQLTKVDLLRRTAEDWGTLTHSSFAPDFDGGHWYYQQGSALSALDVHQSKFSEIWRVSQLPGEVLAVARNHKRLHVLLRLEQLTTDQVDKPRPTRWEHWMYHLPGHRLEYRRSLEWQNEPTCWHLDPKGNLVIHDLPESEESSTSLQLSMFEQGHFKWRKPYSVTEHPVHLSHQDGLMILHTQADQGGHIHLLDTQGGAPLAQIRFFKQVHTRFTSEGVLISDELGCVYLLDKKTLRLECLVRL